MATANDDLEAFLHRLDRAFEKVDAQTYLVRLGPDLPPAVLRIAAPVLVVQVDVAEAPTGKPALEAKLFRRLLELNATDLVYVAFGLEQNRIVLDAALELVSMDLNELEAVLANLDLALAEQVPHLRDLVKQG
jgi:hypothetical protein